MICVDEYKGDELHYNCTNCGKAEYLPIKEPVQDNEAKTIVVRCSTCGEHRLIFVLRCVDEYMAKPLLASFNELKREAYGDGNECELGRLVYDNGLPCGKSEQGQ